jgi:hypothetical protein
METDRFERAVVALAAGELDTDVWRTVAKANPLTFHVWANQFKLLQCKKVISACWYDPKFRDSYKGRQLISDNIEKFHENYTHTDFKAHSGMKPFTSRRAAEALVKKRGEYSYSTSFEFEPDYARVFELVGNFEDLQLQTLKIAGNSCDFRRSWVQASPTVAKTYIENTMYQSSVVKWLLQNHPMDAIRAWAPRKVQDPVMGYIFGGPNIIKQLDQHDEFRHLGYLSILNVSDDNWTDSFKVWWTRHGQFDKNLVEQFSSITLVRDLDDLGDEFFTDRRLRVLENLLTVVPHLKLRVPFVVSIKFKELFLCTNEGEFSHLKKAIVHGIKAFNRPH